MEKINSARRDALTRLIQGAAFSVPLVASFAMGGLTPAQAQAVNSNVTSVPTVSEWALPLVAGGLGAAALVAMNKARKDT